MKKQNSLTLTKQTLTKRQDELRVKLLEILGQYGIENQDKLANALGTNGSNISLLLNKPTHIFNQATVSRIQHGYDAFMAANKSGQSMVTIQTTPDVEKAKKVILDFIEGKLPIIRHMIQKGFSDDDILKFIS